MPIFYTQNYRIISQNKKNYENVESLYQIWGLTAAFLHETLRSILRDEDMKKFEYIN